jgi:acyl-coenzyme A synthetase/AMP-(fatty) acid ligase
LATEKITRWVLVPSLLRTLLNKLAEENKYLPDLKYWTSSGESLPAGLVKDFYQLFPAKGSQAVEYLRQQRSNSRRKLL